MTTMLRENFSNFQICQQPMQSLVTGKGFFMSADGAAETPSRALVGSFLSPTGYLSFSFLSLIRVR